jgi:hypothetical protein
MRILVFFQIFIFFLPLLGFGKIIHVPEDSLTIQAGINGAKNLDTVLLADGTYNGYGNKNLDFKRKLITVMSEKGAGATVIDCENDGCGVFFGGGATSNAWLSGFTIQNGYHEYGGGICCESSSFVTINNNLIKGNETKKSVGAGIYLHDSYTLIANNTIVLNKSGKKAGCGIYFDSKDTKIINNIIYDNFYDQIEAKGGNYKIAYCDIQYGYPGKGNIHQNPLFKDPSNGNYSLLSNSPCIDAGYPKSEIPQGGGLRIDMGAFEFYKGFNCQSTEFLSDSRLIK